MPRRVRALLLLLALAACNPGSPSAGNAGASGASAGYGNAGFGGHTSGGASGSSGGSGGSGAGGQDGGTECAREVRLTAVALGEPEPFDIIIVADHSQSLSWSRESLAGGLTTLLEHAREHTARIFVLTPTQYGASSAAAINRFDGTDMVRWRDPGSDVGYSHAMTDYAQTCMDTAGAAIECPPYDPAGMSEYVADGVWSFVMPEPIASITASMTDDELAEQQSAVSDAILALGGTGSPHEQPLCTLNRYLLQNPEPLPAHAVFIVISDEDDATHPNDCASEYHYTRTTQVHDFAELCTTADCDAYQYLLYENGLNQPISYACAPVDDLGNPLPEGSFDRNTWLNGSLAADCTEPSDTAPCTEGALAWAEMDCGESYIVTRCTSSCAQIETTGCILQTTEDGLDYCSVGFDHEGTHYASMEAYCDATVGARDWLRCERRGYNSGAQLSQTQSLTPLVQGNATDALIDSFNAEVGTRFGVGYFAAVIGFHQDNAVCAPNAGQSYANNLARIASTPEARFLICGDYSGALASVQAFTDQLTDSMLELSLAPDERIAALYAEHENGSRRMIDAALYGFDRARSILTLLPGALQPMELGVAVEVEKTCVVQPD